MKIFVSKTTGMRSLRGGIGSLLPAKAADEIHGVILFKSAAARDIADGVIEGFVFPGFEAFADPGRDHIFGVPAPLAGLLLEELPDW